MRSHMELRIEFPKRMIKPTISRWFITTQVLNRKPNLKQIHLGIWKSGFEMLWSMAHLGGWFVYLFNNIKHCACSWLYWISEAGISCDGVCVFGGFRKPPKNEFCAAHQSSPPAQGSTPAQFKHLSWLKIEYRGSLTTVYAKHIMKYHGYTLFDVGFNLQLRTQSLSLREEVSTKTGFFGPSEWINEIFRNGSNALNWRSYWHVSSGHFLSGGVSWSVGIFCCWKTSNIAWFLFPMVDLSGGIDESPGHEF